MHLHSHQQALGGTAARHLLVQALFGLQMAKLNLCTLLGEALRCIGDSLAKGIVDVHLAKEYLIVFKERKLDFCLHVIG